MQGQLFTTDFLAEGIKETSVWKQLDDASVDAFIGNLKAIFMPLKATTHLNEADTENEIIVKVLAELGWRGLLRQQSAWEKRREDIRDLLLFPDAQAKAAEAHQSKAFMNQIEAGLHSQLCALDFLQARRWAGKAQKKEYQRAWASFLNGEFGNVLQSIGLLSSPTIQPPVPEYMRTHRLLQSALTLAREVRFLH